MSALAVLAKHKRQKLIPYVRDVSPFKDEGQIDPFLFLMMYWA